MKLTTLNPLGEPRNTRERIVWLLANRQVMTFRQLRSAARSSPDSISAQGVYKHLRLLIEDGLVEKQAHSEYAIRLDWVRSLRRLCDDIEHNRQALRMGEAGST